MKLQYEIDLKQAEERVEDGGAALIIESDLLDDNFFIRLQSWDETGDHLTLNSLRGKKLKISIEELR